MHSAWRWTNCEVTLLGRGKNLANFSIVYSNSLTPLGNCLLLSILLALARNESNINLLIQLFFLFFFRIINVLLDKVQNCCFNKH